MTDITLLIIILLINIISIFIVSFITRKATNKADKQDAGGISMEQELGKNAATKKDIEEITQKIENIKNELSFENQRKHIFIEERKERFINILSLVEKLKSYDQLLFYYFHDEDSIDKLFKLIEDANNTMIELVHEHRLLLATHYDKNIITVTKELIKSSNLFCIFLGITASNAKNTMHNIKLVTKLLMEDNGTSEASVLKQRKDELRKLQEEYNESRSEEWKSVNQHLQKYLVILHRLYGCQFHLKLDIETMGEIKHR